ncbi:DUF3408 domain-containing protein [Parabacteroides bouchesdurhonensis]|uniref:DUF3408 domain-containing protein n=1 Tax=Parabacteroides bouchesdurhonensis TaxID=1936995 RepID=UPI00131CDB93|nr:DUF3408 domain-containing protein [Parabacteroides bouchesdurhonensis]
MTKNERTPDIDAEEIIEMFRPEMRRLKPTDVGLESVPGTQRVTSEPIVQTATTLPTDTTLTTEPAHAISNRAGMKQKRATLEEYRETFLRVPRIENRKPVFVSCEVRDRLDEIVRRLGGRRMSVSGLIENLARHHLETYGEDIERWRKL